jgi:hypothetical protein
MGTGSGPSLSTSINYQQYKLNKKRPLFDLLLVEKKSFFACERHEIKFDPHEN